MALNRADRKLILITTGAVVLAGLLFAAVLMFATGTDEPAGGDEVPLYIGPKQDIVAKLDEGSPLYFANPFGGRGFWVDREGGELVALDVGRYDDPDCSIRWKGRVDSYVDCRGERLTIADMARHPVEVLTAGNRKGSVLVELAVVEPPPADSSASTE